MQFDYIEADTRTQQRQQRQAGSTIKQAADSKTDNNRFCCCRSRLRCLTAKQNKSEVALKQLENPMNPSKMGTSFLLKSFRKLNFIWQFKNSCFEAFYLFLYFFFHLWFLIIPCQLSIDFHLHYKFNYLTVFYCFANVYTQLWIPIFHLKRWKNN